MLASRYSRLWLQRCLLFGRTSKILSDLLLLGTCLMSLKILFVGYGCEADSLSTSGDVTMHMSSTLCASVLSTPTYLMLVFPPGCRHLDGPRNPQARMNSQEVTSHNMEQLQMKGTIVPWPPLLFWISGNDQVEVFLKFSSFLG